MKYFSKLILAVLTAFFPGFVLAQEPLRANFTKIEEFGIELSDQTIFKAWKNETVPLVLKIHSAKDIPIQIEVKIGSSKIHVCPYQLAYVLGDYSAGNCGVNKIQGDFETGRFPDRSVEITDKIILPDSVVHYVLLHLTIGENTGFGKYPVQVKLNQNGQVTTSEAIIEVNNQKLPDFKTLDYKVDFWQFPLSVANYYNIEPYGVEHMERLDIMFKQLRYINQQVITTSVFWDLFNSSPKPFDHMMIKVSKTPNGSYKYDYSNFEKYVELGISNGIEKQIAVHNLFPWNNYFFYFDELKGEIVSIRTLPLSDDYKIFWASFLKNFSQYLSQKGWMEKALIYIDEREVQQTQNVVKFIKEINPDFQIGYAGEFYEQLSPYIDDYSVPANVVIEDENLRNRKKSGHETTFYTSCFEKQPNMLMMSNYTDIYFLVMLAKAKGYDGMLRWAFNLWSDQIKENAIYSDVPSGDAHFVYPDGQVSLRYWIIRDALEEILKFENKENRSLANQNLKAHTRYFLLNIETSRSEMVSIMKNYLND